MKKDKNVISRGAKLCAGAMLVAALTAVLFLAGCSGKTTTAQAAGPATGQRPAAPVVVASAEQRDIPVQITAIGNVQAYQTVQIRSQVNGQLQRVYFQQGDDVKKGQLLFQLDKAPFQAALEQAEANLQRDQANAANAHAQAVRYTALENQGVISREQAELMRTQSQANASAVNADKAAVDAAKVQLRYTDIYAPINARAGALMINVGNLIKANDTPYLVQLNQITPVYVSFSIPENQLQEVRRFEAHGRLKVLAYPKGQTSNPSAGTLTFIDNAVDPSTGTVNLKGTFPNTDKRLWPGEFVDVVLNLSVHKNAIVVPTKAIQSGQQGDYVFTVSQDNTAKAQVVKTDGAYRNLTLVSSGLKPGERVVVEGQLRVVPNGKVNVQSTVPTSASANEAMAAPDGGPQ